MFLIFLVALLNLGLGFAIAVYLAHETGAHWARAPQGSALDDPSPPARGLANAETLASLTDAPLVEPPAESPLSDEEAEVEAPSADFEPRETRDGEEAAAIGPSPHQVSVMAIQEEVHRYNDRLTNLSDLFRLAGGEGDADWFEEQRHSLRTANRDFLEARNVAYDAFESLPREVEEYQAIRDTLQEALMAQATRIDEANLAIDAYRFQGDLQEGCRRMLGEAAKLTDWNHQMRDVLEETMVGLARHEQWLETSDEQVRTDALTGLTNRIGLAAGLAEWWAHDPHRVRQLAVALVDVDHFGKLNEQHGQMVADALLRAVAQILAAESTGSSLTARYNGQRFVLLFPDLELRVATSVVERLRQIVETTHFDWEGTELQVTVSCGVVESSSQDSAESLLERADITMREAKRYGRNRSFTHDGKFPSPVVPPNLPLPDCRVTLELAPERSF